MSKQKLSKHKIHSLLNLSWIETNPNDVVFINSLKRKILLIVLPITSAILLLFTLITLIANNSHLNVFYKYTFNITLGNLVFILPLFLMLWWALLLVEKKWYNHSFSWFDKTIKFSYENFKKQLLKVLFYAFVVIVLIDHISLYFANDIYQSFEFQFSNTKNLFNGGFWKNTALNEYSEFNFKHVGFIIEPLFNLLYLLGFSSLFPIIACIVLIVIFALDVYYVNIIKRPLVKLTKLSLPEFIQKVKNQEQCVVYGQSLKKYLDFLFASARALKITYQSLSISNLEKLIFKSLENTQNASKIITQINKESQINKNHLKEENKFTQEPQVTQENSQNLKLNHQNNIKSVFDTAEFSYSDTKIKVPQENNLASSQVEYNLEEKTKSRKFSEKSHEIDDFSPIWEDK
ncbi:hypothetical protein [Mycoplasmopsis columboralis]|uniref:Transmembrane protein n=1 Tax=Mycoplasmopsis columboralis TaxID=171282 RepID=A0A449B789_9BACT|nr:hypothetical protein [Mycoplasmopsis columboralis]VEU76439.1 Uncharacterised protein [Mycoplasmopsis columboralis]